MCWGEQWRRVQVPTPVAQLQIRPLPALSAETPLWQLLQLFKVGRTHMALLCDAPDTAGVHPPAALHLEQ